jgi:hypothetical protein
MISSFSEPGYLIPCLPHPRSCFFRQTQFKRLFGNDLLQRPRLTAEVRHLVARSRTRRVTRKTTFAGFQLRVTRRMLSTRRSDGELGVVDFCLISFPSRRR